LNALLNFIVVCLHINQNTDVLDVRFLRNILFDEIYNPS
jgi:hypothetical protein